MDSKCDMFCQKLMIVDQKPWWHGSKKLENYVSIFAKMATWTQNVTFFCQLNWWFWSKTLMAWFKKFGKLCLIFCKNGTWTENDTDFVKNDDFCQETVMAWFKKFGELCLIFSKNGAWSHKCRLLFVKNVIFQFWSGGVGPPIRWGSFMGAKNSPPVKRLVRKWGGLRV